MPTAVTGARNLRTELKALLDRYPVRQERDISNLILAEDLARCLEAFDQKRKRIDDPYYVPGPSPEPSLYERNT
jgi:hypothetical protein